MVNNAPQPLAFSSPKVRVLSPGRNIYVNPAWNLAASQARSAFLAIVNDDVRFDDDALTCAARVLRLGLFGIVGPDRSCFHPEAEGRRIGIRVAGHPKVGYGTFMCMRREDYVPIPEEMLIWGGDYWLISKQRRPPGILVHTRFVTEMGTTSLLPEFQKMRDVEQITADRILIPLEGERWWHRWSHRVDAFREWRYRSLKRLRRA